MYTEGEIVLLDWINKKKKGYSISSKKYPSYFMSLYNINFENKVFQYIQDDILILNNDIITLSDKGISILMSNYYYIWLKEHPHLNITIKDIVENPGFRKVKFNDIAWGILQSRYLKIAKDMIENKTFKWADLYLNYYNQARILYEEKRYEQCLDCFIKGTYFQFSGLKNDNHIIYLSQLPYNPNYSTTDNFIYMQFPIEYVRNIVKELNLDKKTFINNFINNTELKESLFTNILPFHYFNIEILSEYIASEIYDSNNNYICTLYMPDKIKINNPINMLK